MSVPVSALGKPAVTKQEGLALLAALAITALVLPVAAGSIRDGAMSLRIHVYQRSGQLALARAERALAALETVAAQVTEAQLRTPCTSEPCFTAQCPQGNCFVGDYSPLAHPAACQLQVSTRAAWRDEDNYVAFSAQGEGVSRLVEFLCFMDTGLNVSTNRYQALFRNTVRVLEGDSVIFLQSLSSAGQRHNWQRVDPSR